jgi:YegS/Rv2252/BmrU family lipid kinase
MKKKIRIIINPISGTGKQKLVEKKIDRFIETKEFDFEIRYSEHPGHFTILAEESVRLNHAAVLVAGGDGSINEAAQALVGSKTALGIIPIGSGNGLARHLKIPLKIEDAIKRINQFQTKKIDTANINAGFFVNVAGFGFDAHVAECFSKTKKRGFWNYAKISVQEFFRFPQQSYNLIIDGKQIETRAFIISFANSSQYGNDFVIAPQASLEDALLDVCIIKKPRLYQFPGILFLLARKNIHHSKSVQIIKAKSIHMKLNTPLSLNLDGEFLRQEEDVHISINPLSLKIIY